MLGSGCAQTSARRYLAHEYGGQRVSFVFLGLKPQTVIDVASAYHTQELYQEFREANILLIEPLAEFEPFLRKICATYNAQYVLAAAAETAGRAILNVHRDKVGSSLLKEVEGAAVDGVPRQVPVVTIDEVCAEKNLNGPYLIKVDVQGAELQVLAGAMRTLRETEAVILEVTLFGTMISGPQFYNVVAFMKQYGCRLHSADCTARSTMRSARWTWFSCARRAHSVGRTFLPRPSNAKSSFKALKRNLPC